MALLPPTVQFFMNQIPGTMRGLFYQKLCLDQMHLRRFLSDIPKEPKVVCDVMETEQLLSGY
jgi:hypothetical protein